jgi:hypothetical protein
VHDEQSRARRDQVPVFARPPRRECHDGADATAGGKPRRHPTTHRMANQHNAFRFKPLSDPVENARDVMHRIQPRAVPSATAVLDPSHVDVAAQPAPQRARDEHHPQVGQMPPPGGFVAAHLAARQDEHTRARVWVFWGHDLDSEPTAKWFKTDPEADQVCS